MNNPFSGGWRFGSRPTSVEALYQPKPIDNDFLRRVAALGQDPDKKGLLEQALTATPLQGLLDAPGAGGYGDMDQRAGGQQSSGPTVMSEAGNPMQQVSAAGFAPNFGNMAKGFATGGLLGAGIGALTGGQSLAPVYDMVMPGMNGFIGNDYGSSSALNGPPDAAAAQALADQLAQQLAAYASGGGGGGFSASPGVGGLDAGGSPDGYW